jgi:lipid II:glycine glycyltransferase (peptidoglycan interpeptide bridge formation enzyme)
MHLLFWEAIEEGNREGMSTFDLGRSDIGNQGLITFKDRWGARRSHLQYYVRGTSSRAQTTTMATGEKWTEQAAKRICSRLPHPALCLVGQLLYRHIG